MTSYICHMYKPSDRLSAMPELARFGTARLFLVVQLFVFALVGAVDAQASRNRVGTWDVVCSKSQRSGGKTCKLVQLVKAKGHDNFSLATIFSKSKPGKYSVRIVTPTDVSLEEGVAVQVGSDFDAEMAFTNCTANGCQAVAENANKLVSHFIDEGDASYAVRRHSDEKLIYIKIPLKGFSGAALSAFSQEAKLDKSSTVVSMMPDESGFRYAYKLAMSPVGITPPDAVMPIGFVALGHSQKSVWGDCDWQPTLSLGTVRGALLNARYYADVVSALSGAKETSAQGSKSIVRAFKAASNCSDASVNLSPVFFANNLKSHQGYSIAPAFAKALKEAVADEQTVRKFVTKIDGKPNDEWSTLVNKWLVSQGSAIALKAMVADRQNPVTVRLGKPILIPANSKRQK